MFSSGASNLFYGDWRNIYTGLILGVKFNISKFNIGLNTEGSIRLYSNIHSLSNGGGGLSKNEKTSHYNLSIHPSLEYLFNDKIGLILSYSYGINDAIKAGKNLKYKNRILYLGLNYYLVK